MTALPALFLGFIISTLIGALFHLWRGGGPGRLILYLVLGWLGFWFGQVLAIRFNISFASIGNLHLGMALACGVIFLFIGYWLSLVEADKHPGRPRKK